MKFNELKNKYIHQQIPIAPLISFRIVFGLIMFFSASRFFLNGWVYQLFIEPEFYFTFLPFIKPLSETTTYIAFGIMAFSALSIAFGFLYRLTTILYFSIFTYFELLDKSNYLNHYYFVSLVAFLLIFLPAGKAFSIDNLIFRNKNTTHVPAYQINMIKLMIGILYFFAGVAKLNPDWLFNAMPLKIWLQARYNFPLIGNILTQEWVAYFFSWAGCIFDLSIFFLLIINRTRIFAYLALIFFHVMTSSLFPIGVFPYIMISITTIFFSAEVHQKIHKFIFNLDWKNIDTHYYQNKLYNNILLYSLYIFVAIQLILPFRYLLYQGNLFWHEQGFRFSWRVMLIEKVGYASFYITADNAKGKIAVNNNKYLNRTQIKYLNTQPDMMVQYAHFLKDKYESFGYKNPKVFAEVYITLNGRPSRLFNDTTVDLATQKNNLKQKTWILNNEN